MKKVILHFILLFPFINLSGQDTAIRNVNIIDVKTGNVFPNHSLLITNEKISWVGSDKKIKIDSKTYIIDGKGKYLLPGLIDSHIHFFQSGGLYTRPDAIDLRYKVPYEKEKAFGLENAQDYLKRYLRLGITTVVDAGGPFTNFAIRDSIGKNALSPNILVTGPLFSIVERSQLGTIDPPIIKVSSNREIDSLFFKMIPFKPNFIKIWYIANSQYPAEKSFPLVQYIGQQALKNNLKLAVHATQLKTARLAVEAGAGILVHSIDDAVIPDDFIQTLKEKKVTYIPTLIVGNNYYKTFAGKLPNHHQDLAWANAFAYGTLTDIEAMEESSLPPFVKMLRKNGLPGSGNRDDSIATINLVRLMKAGINIATGTDAGNIGTLHASSYLQETEAMQKAGLSPAEIIKASTINPAVGFGLADKIGSIERNKNADLLLLTKNPLQSIENLNSVEFIFKNGSMIKADTILHESPEAIVQRQLNAYNARNIDSFLATYSADIEIFDSKGKLMMKGHDQMRDRYGDFFKRTDNLYCEIEQRIVINNKVIDKEKVRAGDGFIHGVAIYEVEEGKIRKVSFVD